MKKLLSTSLLATLLLTVTAAAKIDKNAAYPGENLTNAEEIIHNVYYVNHFFGFKNYSIQKKRRDISVIVKKSKGKKPLTLTVERYLNNDYAEGDSVRSKDLAVFRTGQLKGTGMLITDYTDDAKSQEYLLWMPALRKIRRFAQPAHDESWGGTDFTFGDVTLRKPMHETHELLGTQKLGMDVQSLVIPASQKTKLTKNLPGATSEFKDRDVYKVKSTTKFNGWWYDYRISYVDTKTFADYHTEYFKDGKKIKILDKNWQNFDDAKDPRALRWYTWYAKDFRNEHESLAFMPKKITQTNQSKFKLGKKRYTTKNLWQSKTLTKIKK